MTDPTGQGSSEKLRTKIEATADEAAQTLRREASDAADAALSRAEDETMQASRAANAAAAEFDSGTLQAQAAKQVAAGLEHVASVIRDTDLRRTANQVSRFARENPAVFLGGAALIGFAAARFMKSSGVHTDHDRSDDDPWAGHVTSTPSGTRQQSDVSAGERSRS